MRKTAEQLRLPEASPPRDPNPVPGPSDQARATWRRMLDVLRAVIARLGLKEVAFACDVSASQLADALAERDRKGVRAEWLPVVLQLANEVEREALLSELAGGAGYVVERRVNLTPEQRIERLEALVRKRFGEAGADLVDEVTR